MSDETTPPAAALDLETTRARLAELAARGGVVAGAALAHLERLAARVAVLDNRLESMLAHEVHAHDERAEALLGAWDDLRAIATELHDESVARYLAGDVDGCEVAADRARRVAHAAAALDPAPRAS